MYIEEHNHCCMHYFGVKTLSETLFPPPVLHPGYGARQRHRNAGSTSSHARKPGSKKPRDGQRGPRWRVRTSRGSQSRDLVTRTAVRRSSSLAWSWRAKCKCARRRLERCLHARAMRIDMKQLPRYSDKLTSAVFIDEYSIQFGFSRNISRQHSASKSLSVDNWIGFVYGWVYRSIEPSILMQSFHFDTRIPFSLDYCCAFFYADGEADGCERGAG